MFIKEGQFEHLYIRTGNSTRLLTTKEAIEYCKTQWKTVGLSEDEMKIVEGSGE